MRSHLGWQAWRRWRKLRQPVFTRIMPAELKAMLDADENVAVLDLRHALDRLAAPFGISGATWIPPHELQQAVPDGFRRRLVVFYCTCPSSASVLNLARMLHRGGVANLRPLCGGVEAWKRAGYPVEQLQDFSSARARHAGVGK